MICRCVQQSTTQSACDVNSPAARPPHPHPRAHLDLNVDRRARGATQGLMDREGVVGGKQG